MTKPVIGIVVGTRPEVIKMTPIIDRLREAGWCRVEIMASGQHGALLQEALAECGFGDVVAPPPYANITSTDQLVDLLTARLRDDAARLKPDMMLVQGDTATALAGARAASALGIAVGHVEAGLRTYDLDHPFPEEFNRQSVSRLAQLHFAPTAIAAENLIREGAPSASVVITGNTIVDMLERLGPLSAPGAERNLVLVTLHRRELAPHLEGVVKGLLGALDAHPHLKAMIPIQPYAASSVRIRGLVEGRANVEIVPPLTHAHFLSLLKQAAVVVTDSGGVQEEAAIFGTPLVIARNRTERPEVLLSGRAILAGFEQRALQAAITWALSLSPHVGHSGVLGDGQAAGRIERSLFAYFEKLAGN